MRKAQVVAAAAALLVGGGALIAFADTRGGDDAVGTNGLRAGSDSFGVTQGAGGSLAADTQQAAPSAASPVPAAVSRVVKTARIELSVRSDDLVTKATQRANSIAETYGGFVASTEESKGEGRQTTLTLRVPVERYESALGELRRLGKVSSESLGGKDVTSTLVDLEARLRTLRAQEAALNALVLKARTVGETLEVTREAANVRMQIEQLAAQQAQLSDQADLATIGLHVVGPNVALNPEPKTRPLLVDSFERALGGTLAVFGGAIVLLGYMLPAALLAAMGYGIWRLVRIRRPQPTAVAS